MKAIVKDNFISVIKEADVYYGGNQQWWRDDNETLARFGCGIIGICNVEVYLNNSNNQNNICIAFEDYKAYLEERSREIYSLFKNRELCKLGLVPWRMKRGLKAFYKSKGNHKVIKWCPTISKDKMYCYIESMLNHNIPIVASYYTFNKKRKLELYTYDDDNDILKCASYVRDHYFNITGLYDYKGHKYISISSWGKKYYVLYEQWVKKLSFFTNIIYIK